MEIKPSIIDRGQDYSRPFFLMEKDIFNSINCLIFYDGIFYRTLNLEELLKIKSLLDNTIDNIDDVNDFAIEANNAPDDRSYKSKPIQRDLSGFVYIAKCNHTGFFKIGFTTRNVSERMKELRITNSTIELHSYYKSKYACRTEKKLHKYFSELKVRGEWFDLKTINKKAIKAIIKRIEK